MSPAHLLTKDWHLVQEPKRLLSELALAKLRALLFDACIARDKHAFRLQIALLYHIDIL